MYNLSTRTYACTIERKHTKCWNTFAAIYTLLPLAVSMCGILGLGG